ncbi:MAG: branched-chain amino acid ABC transporter permease [Lachnospiraceae bacterium]|nr:branched-chain amino acid ABC transporter permease [Lachnospiraceae bacterium]
MNYWLFFQTLINGLLLGGVYSLIGVGITLVFGVMKIVNFAAGAYLVWGMYFTWVWHQVTGWEAYALIPLVIISMIIFGYITFKLTIRQVLGSDFTTFILITVGLSFFLQNLSEVVFGTSPLAVTSATALYSLRLGTFVISVPRIIAFGGMLIFVAGIGILLNKTLLGRAMRATAENAEVSQMLGINTEKTFTIAFLFGIVMAGIAGLLVTPLFFVSANVAETFRLAPLVAVVLGGLGNIKGALIGGMLVGVIEGLVSTFISADIGVAAICILFLIVVYLFPLGLFGKGARKA